MKSKNEIQKTYISSPSRTAEILKHFNISLRKTYGQNFLIDTNVLKKIATFANLKDDDVVLEIGPGIGSLTEIMLPRVKKIICIEVDRSIAEAFEEIFKEELGKKIIFLNDDAMKIDYEDFCRIYEINKCVSNLPYKIAAPLILKILSETDKITDFYVTIQKDIAERILAKPGDKNYNAFTVKLNFYSKYVRSFSISRNCFYPKPFVGSTTVNLKRNLRFLPDSILYKINPDMVKNVVENENFHTDFVLEFFNFVEVCFYHRRKKLINSLNLGGQFYKKNEQKIVSILEEMGFNKDTRPEELSLENYIFLFISLSPNYSSLFRAFRAAEAKDSGLPV